MVIEEFISTYAEKELIKLDAAQGSTTGAQAFEDLRKNTKSQTIIQRGKSPDVPSKKDTLADIVV